MIGEFSQIGVRGRSPTSSPSGPLRRGGDITDTTRLNAGATTQTRQEAVKRAKDGLDVWDDIFRYAKLGHQAIDPDDYERLKWYGIYQQRPKGSGYFMMRIRIPAGQLTSGQLRIIGKLAQRYARNTADITTRQDIQLHGLTIQDMPDVLDTVYNKLGLYQQFACGDAPRNVTCCPLAGVDADEIVDCREMAGSISHMFTAAGKEFSNLPRKFKIAVGACQSHCHAPQISDIGLFGVMRERDNKHEKGFGLMVGGGLRNTPHFAQSLRVFLPPNPELIRDVCRHVAILFRECDHLRENRLRARLKFHVADVGWQTFRDNLERSLGYELEHDESIAFPSGATHTDHMGIGMQKNGLSYRGVPVERGRLSGDDLIRLAEIADKYTRTPPARLVTTIKQNIILLNLPTERVDDLSGELADAGFPPDAHPSRTSLVSCTGIEFCNLAIVETKQRAKEILNYLEQHVGLSEPLFVSISGCPNSCAHSRIADIGLQGVLLKQQGQRVPGFHLLLRAKLGEDAEFGRFVETPAGKKLAVPSATIHQGLERLLKAYRAEENDGKGFAAWTCRQDMSRLAALLDADNQRRATTRGDRTETDGGDQRDYIDLRSERTQ